MLSAMRAEYREVVCGRKTRPWSRAADDELPSLINPVARTPAADTAAGATPRVVLSARTANMRTLRWTVWTPLTAKAL
jgi:hypothetical protein